LFAGINQDGIWEKANELYNKEHERNDEFCYPECYWILKDKPRWSMPVDDVCKGPSSSSVTQEESGPSQFIRPIGNKRAKENARQMKPQEDEVRTAAQAQKLMAETNVKRLKLLEKQHLLDLLAFPLEGLDTTRKAFVAKWQDREIQNFESRYLDQPEEQPAEEQPAEDPIEEDSLGDRAGEEELEIHEV
jgi:hypothetical protein